MFSTGIASCRELLCPTEAKGDLSHALTPKAGGEAAGALS